MSLRPRPNLSAVVRFLDWLLQESLKRVGPKVSSPTRFGWLGSVVLCGPLILLILFTQHSWGSEERGAGAQHSYLHLNSAQNVQSVTHTDGQREVVHGNPHTPLLVPWRWLAKFVTLPNPPCKPPAWPSCIRPTPPPLLSPPRLQYAGRGTSALCSYPLV